MIADYHAKIEIALLQCISERYHAEWKPQCFGLLYLRHSSTNL